MKHLKALALFLPTAALVVGCAKYEKDPVPDLPQMREHAKVITQMGPDKPREINTSTTVVQPQLVVHEESTLDSKFIVITSDDDMSFHEGTALKEPYKVRVRVLTAGLTVKLVAANLPQGATLTASTTDVGLYLLNWTAPLYTVPANQDMKTFKVKLTAQVDSSTNPADADKLKGLVRDAEIKLVVFKNQDAPSDVNVSGLNAEIAEGTVTPFSVTATIPGIDGSTTQKPRLVISYDGNSFTAGNSFLELDGSRFVVADLSKKDPKYLGDSKWQFFYAFDTKNISVQPQLAKDGSIMTNSDGTRVRLSLKVYNPLGMSTPEKLVQVKITYNKSLSTPRFDVSGLGQDGLVVSPGQKVLLKFSVSSADKTAKVDVTTKDSVLPGTPKVTCAVSQTGISKQDCTLAWTVPCDVTDDKLAGAIEMSATSTVGGRTSDASPYSLKTLASATKDAKLCTGAK